MTEDEWLASRHGQQMLDFVQTATVPVPIRLLSVLSTSRFGVSERKLRLVETACCERIADLLPARHRRELIDIARRRAGGVAGLLDHDSTRVLRLLYEAYSSFPDPRSGVHEAIAAFRGLLVRTEGGGGVGVLESAAHARAGGFVAFRPLGIDEGRRHQALADERAAQADIVRDVIGDPFRPERIDPSWPLANDRAAIRIAEGGTFADLPVLADALEDAGCTSPEILDHCRGAGPHVAGCWVVDLVLGRE